MRSSSAAGTPLPARTATPCDQAAVSGEVASQVTVAAGNTPGRQPPDTAHRDWLADQNAGSGQSATATCYAFVVGGLALAGWLQNDRLSHG
jgi:hypothetical protein